MSCCNEKRSKKDNNNNNVHECPFHDDNKTLGSFSDGHHRHAMLLLHISIGDIKNVESPTPFFGWT